MYSMAGANMPNGDESPSMEAGCWLLDAMSLAPAPAVNLRVRVIEIERTQMPQFARVETVVSYGVRIDWLSAATNSHDRSG
jgi:hypothetical protein